MKTNMNPAIKPTMIVRTELFERHAPDKFFLSCRGRVVIDLATTSSPYVRMR